MVIHLDANKLSAIGVSLFYFFLSLIIFPHFTGGDQFQYHFFYEKVTSFSLPKAYDFYLFNLGSHEPGYFVLVYIFSPFFEKNIFFSFINLLFSYFLFLWLYRNKVNSYVILLLSLNFYMLVLAFSAERLKVAFLVYLIGYFCNGKWRYVIWVASIFIHVQLILTFVSTQSSRFLLALKSLFKGKLDYSFFILAFFAAILVFIFLREHILAKFTIYQEYWGGAEGVIKPAIFAVLSMFYARSNWKEALIAIMPIVLISFFVGSQRTTMMCYFIFMYYALQYRRGMNIAVLMTSLYFAIKGALFLNNIFEFGDGFYSAARF